MMIFGKLIFAKLDLIEPSTARQQARARLRALVNFYLFDFLFALQHFRTGGVLKIDDGLRRL